MARRTKTTDAPETATAQKDWPVFEFRTIDRSEAMSNAGRTRTETPFDAIFGELAEEFRAGVHDEPGKTRIVSPGIPADETQASQWRRWASSAAKHHGVKGRTKTLKSGELGMWAEASTERKPRAKKVADVKTDETETLNEIPAPEPVFSE